MDLAACKGKTHLMFPAYFNDKSYVKGARDICSACPVRKECLEYALEFNMGEMHGVWAGKTIHQLEREQIKRGLKPVRPTIANVINNLLKESTVSRDVVSEPGDVVAPKKRGRPRKSFG